MSNNNLIDLLQGQLSEGLLDQLTQQVGGADRQKTAIAASGIMSTLMGALAKNASNPEGARALDQALERDHDGSILKDVTGMLMGNAQPQNSKMLNGSGILNHVLGNKQGGAIEMISKMSGLDSSKTGSLMTMLAPLVMGALGKTKREQGLGVDGISNILAGAVTTQKQKDPSMDLVSRFLDQDGDGSVIDDVANMGMKILGGFLKRKK